MDFQIIVLEEDLSHHQMTQLFFQLELMLLMVHEYNNHGVALHLYNLIQELEGSFIIISEKPVSQMDIKLRDLASRVSTMSTVELKLPDDEIIKGVMGKLFKDRQINVSNDVVNYLCRRMERSFKEVGRLVDRLDKISLSEKNTISLSLARRILQETC